MRILLGILLLCVLTACSMLGGGAETSQEEAPAAATPAADPAPASSAPAVPDAPAETSAPAPSAPPSAPAIVGGTSQDLSGLDLSDRHQNGVQLQVTGITTASTSVGIDVSAVNGYTDEVQLNSRNVFLLDDQGNSYNFSAPTTNENLRVDPGAELTGTLVFLGRLDPSASSLTLKINVYDADDPVDVADRYNRATNPEMLVENIPVPS